MITFENMWLWLEERLVLEDLTFSIKSDERVAILGPSGVGKTTILKLILGLLIPDSGMVLIDGNNLALLSEDKLRKNRLKFSIVFQEGALFDSLSVRENVAFFYKEHTNLANHEIDEAVDRLLERVDLALSADLMPEQLSGGMKRRVSIARALAVENAKMHLYDEPTSGLDPVNSSIIRDLILKVSSSGKGFIIVTHEILDALFLANRFMFLRSGKIIFDGPKEELLNSKISQVKEFLEPYYRLIKDL